MINECLRDKIKALFKDKKQNGKTISIVLKTNSDIKQELEEEFNKHPKEYMTIGKLVCLILKDVELSKCLVCGKPVTYNTTFNGKERKFCSNKCKLSKEGNPFAQSDIKEKIKQTNIERFGVDNPAKSKVVQEKMQQTCMDKYGVKNVFQSEEKKEKIKKTMIERHGSASIYGDPELRKKAIYNKKINTYTKILQKYKNKYAPLFTIDEYKGVRHYYKWKCVKCGNVFEAQYNNGQITSRCFVCEPTEYVYRSTYEDEIVEFLKQYNLDVETNNRKIIWPKELDIVIPEKKVAIEFNGTYWHSMKIHKDKKYHVNKLNACLEKGYKLITIWEYDWINEDRKNIIKNKLKEVLHLEEVNNNTKFVIKEITKDEKNKFLEKYHLSGKDSSSIKLGVFENNTLTAVMTFNKSKFDKTYEYEINRFAYISSFDINFKRLFNYFVNVYNPKSVIFYQDRCFYNDETFNDLNFTLLRNSNPNYNWVLDDVKYPKYSIKNVLKENIDKLDNNLTEYENIVKLGFNQIYDCGNTLFVKEF